MYRISVNKRKWSTTPIVEVTTTEDGKEHEEIVFICTLPKKTGDALSEKVVNLLNRDEFFNQNIKF